MQDLRRFMHHPTNTMTAELAHHAVSLAFNKLANRITDITRMSSGEYLLYAFPHRLIGHSDEALCFAAGFRHHIGFIGIDDKAIFL